MADGSGSITLTVLVSAATSGLISIATFIIGVRMAKDQGDRATLRQLYQRLFEHFRTLHDAIEDSRPKGWSDFPAKAGQYMPAFRQMQADGEANLLPPALIATCDDFETRMMNATERYRFWVRETYTPALRALIAERAPGKAESKIGQSYRELSAIELGLMPRESRAGLATQLDKHGTGIGLGLSIENGKIERRHIYPDMLISGSLADFLDAAAAIRSNDLDGQGFVEEIRALVPQLEALLVVLKARIRDPHPLHEGVLRSFRDLFAR